MAILNNQHCSVLEAAEIIGCTDGRVRQLLRAEKLKGIKVNDRAWLVNAADARRVGKIEPGAGAPRGSRE